VKKDNGISWGLLLLAGAIILVWGGYIPNPLNLLGGARQVKISAPDQQVQQVIVTSTATPITQPATQVANVAPQAGGNSIEIQDVVMAGDINIDQSVTNVTQVEQIQVPPTPAPLPTPAVTSTSFRAATGTVLECWNPTGGQWPLAEEGFTSHPQLIALAISPDNQWLKYQFPPGDWSTSSVNECWGLVSRTSGLVPTGVPVEPHPFHHCEPRAWGSNGLLLNREGNPAAPGCQ